MTDELKLTPEQKMAQIARAKAEAARLLAVVAELEKETGTGGEGGSGGNGGGEGRRAPVLDSTREVLAQQFQDMTPRERMELFQTDRERWQKHLDAIQELGWRKLMPEVFSLGMSR